MSFTDIYQISGSAMTAQTLRLNTVASNLANANAPASSEAQAYKARSPVFAAVYHHSLLAGTHRHAIDGASVQVQDVLQTGGAVKRYEPHSPLADACTTADLHFTDAAGDDYTVSLIPQGSSSVGPGQVDFSVNPADYGIPPGDYDVSVVTNTGEEEVPIEVSGEVEDVRIPLDGSSPVLNVAGVGEVPFTMISQFGVPDADSDVA